ncbi:unnamed protein product, partial [Mesorhabditis spiculigera]
MTKLAIVFLLVTIAFAAETTTETAAPDENPFHEFLDVTKEYQEHKAEVEKECLEKNTKENCNKAFATVDEMIKLVNETTEIYQKLIKLTKELQN